MLSKKEKQKMTQIAFCQKHGGTQDRHPSRQRTPKPTDLENEFAAPANHKRYTPHRSNSKPIVQPASPAKGNPHPRKFYNPGTLKRRARNCSVASSQNDY